MQRVRDERGSELHRIRSNSLGVFASRASDLPILFLLYSLDRN